MSINRKIIVFVGILILAVVGAVIFYYRGASTPPEGFHPPLELSDEERQQISSTIRYMSAIEAEQAVAIDRETETLKQEASRNIEQAKRSAIILEKSIPSVGLETGSLPGGVFDFNPL